MIVALLFPMVQVVAQTVETPANEHFQRVWERTDRSVAEGAAERTWIWGPAVSGELSERYGEPDDRRVVQYFDKSRMEITDSDADPESNWYVTNGLLAVELISGRMQLGDDEFKQRLPSEMNVAGDQGFANGPSYGTFRDQQIREHSYCNGTIICERVERSGVVTYDETLADQGIAITQVDEETGHKIAGPFWTFMNSTGKVFEDGIVVADHIFGNPYYATGRPITEPYWAEVIVAGTERLVLIQCFERRCLTFTPANERGWQVEAGNIGQHYYSWRYAKTPNPGGALLFYRGQYDDVTGNFTADLYTVDVDGSALTSLTDDMDGGVYGAVWSPDGSRIAFVSGTGTGDLYVMDADGASRQQLTSGEAVDGEPDWSPDSSQLVFTRSYGEWSTDIWIINADGTGERQVTDIEPDPQISDASGPDWSPDGQQVAFALQTRITPLIALSGIYIVDVDGSNLREVVPQENVFLNPDWSPDGNTILFIRPQGASRDVYGSVVYTVDANVGPSSIRKVAGEDFTHPRGSIWTPNGKSITMTWTPARQPGAGTSTGTRGIVTIDLDTLEKTQITHFGENANWSSDGEYLTYVFPLESQEASSGIAITDASGQTQWIVTENGFGPQWRPTSDAATD